MPDAVSMPVETRKRIESIDLVRGLIIIVMALDHTRDFFGDLAADPTALAATTPGLFFTRWITHFCAPAFFLLTGTGAFLSLARMSKPELSRWRCASATFMAIRPCGRRRNHCSGPRSRSSTPANIPPRFCFCS
jgi:uncharacterized membrane protein